MLPAETATVAGFASGICDTASATFAKNPPVSGSAGTPSRFGSWLAPTVRPTPILIPVRVAGLMFSTRDRRRNARMARRLSPTRKVSVNASRMSSSASRGVRSARVVATRTAMVEVVETLRVREPPSSA